MVQYILRRLLFAIPTLLIIALIIFGLLKFAPGDPASQLPLTIPDEVKAQIRESLGLGKPWPIQFFNWLKQLFITEPKHLLESWMGSCIGDCVESGDRIISWSSRSPAMDIIYERLPQTLWVMGTSFVLGTLIAIPIGVYSAYKQYSAFDNIGTLITMFGYSVPVYFTGTLLILFFSVKLNWLPSYYDTTHEVSLSDPGSIWVQLKQMLMPVAVLTLFNASSMSRFTRASVLDNLQQEYVRTARSKGVAERPVVIRHVLRNSLIPVATLIALAIPGIFSGAILTESVFRINGMGQLLLGAIGQGDLFMVQTITFLFALLTVVFNLVADVAYGLLDPRIRFE